MAARDGALEVAKPQLIPFYDSLGVQIGWMYKDKPELAALLYMLDNEFMGNC